jgi:hypothetical protein
MPAALLRSCRTHPCLRTTDRPAFVALKAILPLSTGSDVQPRQAHPSLGKRADDLGGDVEEEDRGDERDGQDDDDEGVAEVGQRCSTLQLAPSQ